MDRLPSNWQVKSLGEIATRIQYGFTQSASVQKIGPKFLRITDIQNGIVEWNTVPYCSCDGDKYILKDGDIIFARTGATTGKSYLVKDPPLSVFASYLIRVQLNDSIHSQFIYQYFQTKNYWRQINQNIAGSTQGGFNATKLYNLKLPIPPLSIQKQIAEILEKADQSKQKRIDANKLTEQFIQSAFIEMFGDPVKNPKGWEVKRFDEITEIIMGQSPLGDTYNEVGNGFPLLNGPAEFGKKYPIEVQWTTNPTKMSKVNDILFCVRGATAGRMNWSDKEYCIGRGLAAIRSRKNSMIEVIYFFLKIKYSQFQSLGQGSTFINLSKDLISSMKIPVPPLSLQQQFAELVQKTEALKEKQKESEKQLENLFNSLMQKAFKGELVS